MPVTGSSIGASSLDLGVEFEPVEINKESKENTPLMV